ncbi:serine/threonine-protein kinase [Streptosporangium sp. KLBMP 9127]|nr:serine/threonine protein kinase [Streptosporangium sp. KLBMP 9127]
MTSHGPKLGDRYLLVSRIAAGGMGEVWRARDELLGREVAVKLLRQHVAADPAFRRRFRTEAQITAGLADPGIAQVYDYGEHADVAYLVMELVSGEPLSAILARNPRLSPEVTLDVVHQSARALETAHESGIIHRDVKPGNMLVTQAGVIKITDFGIARAMEAAPVTQTGTVLGTAQYVSPEQASGSPLTPSTDLYSLGVVAYECLAGRLPFGADTQVALALQHLNDPPPPLPGDIPGPVRGLVMALLAKDPRSRPGSARELADRAYALRESLAGSDAVDLSNLTDPVGRRVRRGQDTAQAQPQPAPPPLPFRPGEPGLYDPASIPGMPARTTAQAPRKGRRRTTTVLVATAGCAAAVGLGALALAQLPEQTATGGTEEPTQRVSKTPPAKPTKTARPPTRVRTSVPAVKSPRPSPSPSASVSSSATPTRTPTPKPTPTTPTPTPTPTPTQTLTPSMTPVDPPDPGDTNPPKGET